MACLALGVLELGDVHADRAVRRAHDSRRVEVLAQCLDRRDERVPLLECVLEQHAALVTTVALEIHLVDAPRERPRHVLRHLHAEARRIHRQPRDRLVLARHPRPQVLLLRGEVEVVEGLALDEHQRDAELDPLLPRRRVLVPGDVVAREAGRVRILPLDAVDLLLGQLARREILDRQELAARVLHLALELALPGLLRAGASAGLLQELFARLTAAGLLVDLLDEALGDGVMDRDAVQRGVLRIVLLRVGDHLRERRLLRSVDAVGADDLQLVAPHDARIRHVDQRAGVTVQVGLVEEDVAALARERLRSRRERDDARAVQERADERRDALVLVDDLFVLAVQPLGDDVAELAPHADVVADQFLGGELVAGRHPLDEALAAPEALLEHAVGRGVGEADPARLLRDLQRRLVVDPLLLIGEEVGR